MRFPPHLSLAGSKKDLVRVLCAASMASFTPEGSSLPVAAMRRRMAALRGSSTRFSHKDARSSAPSAKPGLRGSLHALVAVMRGLVGAFDRHVEIGCLFRS